MTRSSRTAGFTPRLVISRNARGVLTRISVPMPALRVDDHPDDLTAVYGVPVPRRADVIVEQLTTDWRTMDRVGNELQPRRDTMDDAMPGARALAEARGGAVWLKKPAPYGLRPHTEHG